MIIITADEFVTALNDAFTAADNQVTPASIDTLAGRVGATVKSTETMKNGPGEVVVFQVNNKAGFCALVQAEQAVAGNPKIVTRAFAL